MFIYFGPVKPTVERHLPKMISTVIIFLTALTFPTTDHQTIILISDYTNCTVTEKCCQSSVASVKLETPGPVSPSTATLELWALTGYVLLSQAHRFTSLELHGCDGGLKEHFSLTVQYIFPF